jgi:hypothetical protein
VHDRHLTADEIQQQLDDELAGVATLAPALQAHLRDCLDCQGEVAQAEALVMALAATPDLAPSAGFADRVMRDVQVFEPWYAALDRTFSPFVPASWPARVAAGIAALIGSGVTVAGAWWALQRADIAVFLASIGLDEARTQLLAAGHDLSTAVLGPGGVDALRTVSMESLALWTGAFVVAAGLGLVGIRAMATAADRSN